MKKVLFIYYFLCCPFISFAALDMSQDRPFTTDTPPPPSQVYYKADNPTRKCILCPRKINRWARCNAKSLKIKRNYFDPS